MIKVALKHFIYEKCIELLFSGIRKNFKQPDVVFKNGAKYMRMDFEWETTTNQRIRYIFHTCTVLSSTVDTVRIKYYGRHRYIDNRCTENWYIAGDGEISRMYISAFKFAMNDKS